MLGSSRKVPLDIVMAGWGLGTWLGINGMYVQLPLLVERLPESWALPASMTVAIQIGNSGLLLYALLRRVLPRVPDGAYIYGLLSIGALALFLNAFLYDQTAVIGSDERSIAFLSFTFFAGFVGCTSSVLFYPYLRHFRDIYLATYLVGEGLSGFIPSILALIQGVGGAPECVPSEDNSMLIPIYPPARFDIMVFMLLLSVLGLFSLISFGLVHRLPFFQTERVEPAAIEKRDEAEEPKASLLSAEWVTLMIVMMVLNAMMNGVLPSIQSYSCMPYGTSVYHLAVTLSTMANPLACLAGVWLKPLAPRALAAFLAAAALPFGYILATALLSPTPPLVGNVGGEILVVVSWVLCTGMVSYARMWVYGWARGGGAKGMRAVGAATQAGSAIGSLLLFFLVNYANVFVQADACPPLES